MAVRPALALSQLFLSVRVALAVCVVAVLGTVAYVCICHYLGFLPEPLARVSDAALLPVVTGISDDLRDPDDCVDVRGGVRVCVWVDDSGTHAVRVVGNPI